MTEWNTTSTILHGLCDYGNQAAWQRLAARFRRPIVSFARQLGLSPHDAEDAAQETLLAFAEAYRRGQYDATKGRLSRWLFGIAYRQALRSRRDDARRVTRIADVAAKTELFADITDEESASRAWDREWEQAVWEECLRRAAAEFETPTMQAFELAVRSDRPVQQVAQDLGVTTKSVYNAKHRVLKRVRELRAEFEAV